jgi:hypothetical protein
LLLFTGIEQSQPKPAFLGLLPADLDSEQEILVAQGLISLDVIRRH